MSISDLIIEPIRKALSKAAVDPKTQTSQGNNVEQAATVVEASITTFDIEPELREPQVFDRGDRGRFVWVPEVLRNFLYMDLDIDGLFHNNAVRMSESLMSPVDQRVFKNTYSIALHEFLPRINEIQSEFEENGRGELSDEDLARFEKLLAYLQEERNALNERFKDINSETSTVTAEELVLFLNTKGKLFGLESKDTIIAFESRSAKLVKSFFGSYISIKGGINSNFGEGIQQSETELSLPYFTGSRPIKETGLKLLSTDAELTSRLLERGKKYLRLTTTPSYIQYTGIITRETWWTTNYFKATGRAMIDISSMRAMDTDYRNYFGWDSYSRRQQPSVIVNKAEREYTDIEYITMVPFIYGFSFVSKVWGEMLIDNVSEIKFRENAYDMLVLDAERKDMMFSLVENGMSAGDKDFIAGKGGGVIFMLAGTPGTGKTLSAEAIAEKLKRPLYMVGVGELGTDVVSLENSLRNVLDVATKWNAVLLIDECDIFMQARNDADIERNAMVGIFLRLLEYYEGVLFLTTNRADNIDEAFYSRISLAMHYEALTTSTREQVWTNLLATYGITGIDVKTLSHHDLNGRKIKQVIRIGSALAAAKGREPSVDDFVKVIDKELEFRDATSRTRR